ncbi:hypothetical protein NQZ68_008677 [Dissostichus eleginoides]|nr:hypothetical protein NQZ68_008677 [Dissostichus eleginoides]
MNEHSGRPGVRYAPEGSSRERSVLTSYLRVPATAQQKTPASISTTVIGASMSAVHGGEHRPRGEHSRGPGGPVLLALAPE